MIPEGNPSECDGRECALAIRPLSLTTPRTFIPPGAEALAVLFGGQWLLHHHGPALSLVCPRVSSEITVAVILCKYSRRI